MAQGISRLDWKTERAQMAQTKTKLVVAIITI